MNIGPGKINGTFKPTPQFRLPAKFAITESFVARPGVDFTVYPKLKEMMSRNMVIFRRPSYKIYTTIDTTSGSTLVERFATPLEERGNGWDGFYSYVKNAIKYPVDAKEDRVEGVVLLAYLVNEDGSFSDFTVLKSVGSGCDEEAIRIMREYTLGFKWNPAMKDRKPIPQRFELPVKFSLGSDTPKVGKRAIEFIPSSIPTRIQTEVHSNGISRTTCAFQKKRRKGEFQVT
ncbi:MAG: energy transducer TonB [Bacteroidota bacterium]